MGKHLVHKRVRELMVGAAVENDAVLPGFVHLNDGVAVCALAIADKFDMHARGRHFFAQKLSLAADEARVVDLCAGAGQRNGLVQALAAAADGKLRAAKRFAGPDKMLHLIDVVDIARAEIDDPHIRRSFFCFLLQ